MYLITNDNFNWCDECNTKSTPLVSLGQDEECIAHVCKDCLSKALLLIDSKEV